MSDEAKLVSHYRLKTLLRRDGFGAVYFAEDTRDQKEYLLRIIELDQATLTRITGRVRARSQRDHPLIEQIRQRMKRISELKNSHVLPVIEFGEEHIQGNNDIIFYMVSPYEKESLLAYWSERTGTDELISLEIVSEFIFQAAEALFYVHRRGLIHQYVRLSSFMLRSSTRARRLHLYLTDFWFADISAALLEEGQISQDLSVYLAIEQLAGKAVFASDQYALAVMAYELLLGYRLSQVDLSLGLYERFVRQRGIDVSEVDLELAHRIDLVLARALAENVTARYQSIEEFASTFRAVARGESVFLEEDTAKFAAISASELRSSRSAEEIAVAATGAVVAGEIIEEISETQVEGDEVTRTRHPSLHKTILTAEGMEIVGEAVAEETIVREQETILSTTAQSGTVVAGEETLTVIDEEQTQSSSSGMVGAADLIVGLAAGEAIQRSSDLSEEQTLLVESSTAAFIAGEARQSEIDFAEEQIEMRESNAAAFAAGAAAGLIAGEARQGEIDLAEEQIEIRESSAAAFAAGAAAGAVQQSEIDFAEEQIEVRESSAAAFAAGATAGAATGFIAGEVQQSEIDLAEERTERRGSSAAAFAAGATAGAAAGFIAGEAQQSEIDLAEERTERRGSSAAAFAAGAAGFAAAGEISAFEQERDIAEEQTQIIAIGGGATNGGAANGAAIYGQETDVAEEQTQIIPIAAGGALLAGVAGLAAEELLAAGELLASGLEATEVAAATALAGGELLTGGMDENRAAGGAGAGGKSVLEEAAIVGGAAAAGLAAASLAAEGSSAAGGYAGGAATSGATQAAAAGGAVAGGAALAGAGLAAGGAAQSAGGVGGLVGGTTQSAGGGVLPPPVRNNRVRRGRTLLVAIIIALLLVLIGGSVFALVLNQSSATVTVTLQNHTIQNTYLVTATAGASGTTTTTTTTTSGQVQANLLTQSTTLSQSGQASGYYPGVESSGFIKLSNSSTGCGCPVFVPAGTPFVASNGVTVVIDYGVSVASQCSVTVPAHAMTYGPGGNIAAGSVQAAFNAYVSAVNPYAFKGGQVGKSNALVQQSDISRVSKTLQAQAVQSAQTSLQSQVKSNQRLFAQPVCLTKVKPNHAAGSHASSVKVTVVSTCTAEAYDYNAAMQIVQQQVQTEASSYSSEQYALVDGLKTTVVSATVTDAKAGTLLLAIKAVGKWIYKWTNSMAQSLSRAIAGQNVDSARSILRGFLPTSRVDFNISGLNSNTLPSDGSKIKITVKN